MGLQFARRRSGRHHGRAVDLRGTQNAVKDKATGKQDPRGHVVSREGLFRLTPSRRGILVRPGGLVGVGAGGVGLFGVVVVDRQMTVSDEAAFFDAGLLRVSFVIEDARIPRSGRGTARLDIFHQPRNRLFAMFTQEGFCSADHALHGIEPVGLRRRIDGKTKALNGQMQ